MMDALSAKIKRLFEEDDPRIAVEEYIIPPETGDDAAAIPSGFKPDELKKFQPAT